jgi:GNAT superfamily N-acetyltransferase
MVAITEEPIGSGLAPHAQISIAFVVDRVFDLTLDDGGLRGLSLSEVSVESPWIKDYDAEADEGPTRWPKRFDVTNWGLLAAHDGERRVGGAVIAYNSDRVNMLEGRSDLAVLWDLRVAPQARSTGIGTLLFRASEEWARDRGCTTLKVETQNINVAACRFYRRMGCELRSLNRFAYPDLPTEIQLIWSKQM